MKYCDQCGTSMEDSAGFCPNCGAPVGNAGGGNGGYQPNNDFNGGYNGGGYDNSYNGGYSGGPAGGYGGNPGGIVSSITGKMRTSATIWMVIGIIQIVVGACTICFGYGAITLFLGIWNVIQSSKQRKNAAYFDQNPVGIVNYFESRGTILIVFLVLNLLGSYLFGVIGSIYELMIRSDALSHRNELLQVEASFMNGGYNNGGVY